METIIIVCLLVIAGLLTAIITSLCQSANSISDSAAKMTKDISKILDVINQTRLDALRTQKRPEDVRQTAASPEIVKTPEEKIQEKIGERKTPAPVHAHPQAPDVGVQVERTVRKLEAEEKWRPAENPVEKMQTPGMPPIPVVPVQPEMKTEMTPEVKKEETPPVPLAVKASVPEPVKPAMPEAVIAPVPHAVSASAPENVAPAVSPTAVLKLELPVTRQTPAAELSFSDAAQKNVKPEHESEKKPDGGRIFMPRPQTGRESFWDAHAWALFQKGWNWFIYGKEHLEEGDSVEYVVAANWMVRIGILFLILATGFFLRYSIEQGWISPVSRVLMASGLGVSMYLYGLYLFGGKLRLLGQGLAAGGAVVLYFSVYAATEIYSLISPTLGFVGMSVVTAMLVMSALKRDSILIAVIGTAGAYCTPILFNVVPVSPVPVLAYLAVLAAGILAIRFRHDWVIPMWISLIGTYVLLHLIMMNFDLSTLQMQTTPRTAGHLTGITQDITPDRYGFYAIHHVEHFFFGEKVAEKPLWSGSTMCFACVFFVLLHVAVMIRSLRASRHGHNWEFTLVTLNSLAFCVTMYMLIMKFAPLQYASWVPGGLGVFFLLHAIYFWRRNDMRVWQIISLSMAIMYFAILVPTYFSETRMWILPCWAIEAAVLMWAGRKLESRNMVRVATAMLALILVGSSLEMMNVYVASHAAHKAHAYYQTESCLRLMPERFARFLIPVIAAALAAYIWRRAPEKTETARTLAQFFTVAVGVLLFFFANGETVLNFQVYNREATLGAVSVLWMAFSLACIAGGILRSITALRFTGLWLFGITVAKVLLWDMAQSAVIHRIIAFFIVGVLIMIGAALYLRATRGNEELTKKD